MNYHGHKLWTMNGKIYVPEACRQSLVEWYHDNLRHSGTKRTSATIRQYFNWPGASTFIEHYVKKCGICQKYKITGAKKYGKIPPPDESQSSVPPFHTIHVDMIGPWKIYLKIAGKKVSRDV